MALAVQADPSIRLAQEARTLSVGVVQENAGPFDLSLAFLFSFDSARSELNEAQLRGQRQRRDIFRQLSNNLDAVADDLQDQLGGTDFVWADCPSGLDITIGSQRICISGRLRANYELWHDLAEATGASDIAAAMVLANRREAANTVDVLHLNAFIQRMNLRHMGSMPSVNETLTTAFDLRLTKMFRNGIVLEPGLILDAVQDNFVGKPANPEFGGKGIPDNVRSILGLTLDIPLGKGRGIVSTGAAEAAAKASADAALADEAFSISKSVERTALAYWDLAAAQALLELLQRSEALQVQLLEMGETLVEADEYPAADLHFVRGRVDLTRGRVASVQEQVAQAQVALAKAMGQQLTTIDQAPLAADSLPDMSAILASVPPEENQLVAAALGNRYDVAAANYRVVAANTLAKAASFDLKRRVDLQLGIAYVGLEEGGDVTTLNDLTSGWWNAVSDFSAGPSFRLTLDFELPFGNSAARGRSAQSFALERQSRIQSRNLERIIANEVDRLVGSLRRAIDEGRRRTVAVESFRDVLGSDIELFRAGEGSSIDVVLAQEQLVAEEITLVAVRRSIARLATQLSFQVGRLVECRIDDGGVTVEAFHSPGDALLTGATS
jgi:outer membrane protein TolC